MNEAQSERDIRLQKLQSLRDKGINPYPEKYERTHNLDEAIKQDEKTNVKCAGRVILKRDMGKLCFAHLRDWSGKMQLVFNQEVLGKDEYKLFIKHIDMADFIGVEGEIFTTQKGEISILVNKWTILSKALRPLPEKFHGLTDTEACYRERYLDLIMNQDTRDRFIFRSNFVRYLREFYWQNGFIEVDTPVISPTASGALATPFLTHHNALDEDMFLRIAPETALKKTTVGGFEKVFEVARCFRNEGIDPSHLQDFSMCEHYGVYWNFEDNIKFTEDMYDYIFDKMGLNRKLQIPNRDGKMQDIDFTTPWPRYSIADLIKKDSGIDIDKYENVNELRKVIKDNKIEVDNIDNLGRGNMIDGLYKAVSRHKLIGPMFIVNHPTDVSPLARRNDANPKIVDRFQLVINTWEVINAYSELVDPVAQDAAFDEQAKIQAGGDADAHGKDDEYVKCMEHGMPPQSGWGMGIARIVALLTAQTNLKDVVLFPLLRPEHKNSEVNNKASGSRIGVLDDIMDKSHPVPSTPYSVPQDSPLPSREEAWELLNEHLKKPNNLIHSRESEVVLRGLAKHFGENEDLWGLAGLMHDIDWDKTENEHERHALLGADILEQNNYPTELVNAVRRHNYVMNGSEAPETKLDIALLVGETITGLIYAATLVRPDKSLQNVEVKSIKKKFKDKSFAAKVNRDTIRECEKLGLELSEFFEIALNAMKEIAEEIGL